MIIDQLTTAIETLAPLAAGVAEKAAPAKEAVEATGPETMSLANYFTALLMLIGTGFCSISAFGIIRMPDIYTRMQAAAKAGTLGVVCIMAAAAVHFVHTDAGWLVTTEALLIIIFIFATTPSSAHLIARAAYVSDTEMWEGTQFDDLATSYANNTKTVAGATAPNA